MQFWVKLSTLLGCGFLLHGCIVVPESTHQVESTTRVFVDGAAQGTQVKINRPQVIIVERPYHQGRPYAPQYHVPPNCHLQSNGRSMGPIPTVCD